MYEKFIIGAVGATGCVQLLALVSGDLILFTEMILVDILMFALWMLPTFNRK